jgi:hypothetical protein
MSRLSARGSVLGAALLLAAAFPAAASAVPFTTSANGGRLTIGNGSGAITDQPIVPAGSPVVISGDLDPGTGNITVPQSGFTFPPVDFTTPLPGRLTTTALGPATGHLDLATGEMTLDVSLSAAVHLTVQNADCVISPVNFTLTTGAAAGGRYPQGSPLNQATGAVKLVGFTPSPNIPASTGDPACAALNIAAGLPNSGSIEFSNTPAAPGSPALAAKFSPKKRTVHKDDKAKFTLEVSNGGNGSATGVETCVEGKGGVKFKKECFDDGTLAAGASVEHQISAKAKNSGKVKASVTSSNGGSASASAKVKVKGKK